MSTLLSKLFGKLDENDQKELSRLVTLLEQNPKRSEEDEQVKTEAAATKEVKNDKVKPVVEVKAAPAVEVTVETPPVVVVEAKKEPTKSDLIRAMYKSGSSVAEIAKATSSHYSFVYGVCRAVEGASPTKQSGPSKSDDIRTLAAEGKTPGEIAKVLNSNYSFVHSVVKKWKEEQQ